MENFEHSSTGLLLKLRAPFVGPLSIDLGHGDDKISYHTRDDKYLYQNVTKKHRHVPTLRSLAFNPPRWQQTLPYAFDGECLDLSPNFTKTQEHFQRVPVYHGNQDIDRLRRAIVKKKNSPDTTTLRACFRPSCACKRKSVSVVCVLVFTYLLGSYHISRATPRQGCGESFAVLF